ncbi:type I restriction-modification system subunit M N-terminal domain-containing protein [Haloferula sargassicola]|uniref:N6 adenine-specific DNA methyltransferase N-terminal domain-containing protein n=1 Tax=Haloferula sargassicola TaxID=490096 RepID=A0ABP9UVU7_9BACT
MPTDASAIVSKVWNYAHVLKNAGVGYGDYVEQITYLLFLKLADEMTELGFDNPIPAEFQWSELSNKVAAASRRSLSGRTQRRVTSATLVPSWPTN